MQELNLLNRIKKVEVRDSLFDELLVKTERGNIVPLHIIRAAAAVFLCLISLEIFIASEIDTSAANQTTTSLISSSNIYLDYE